MDEKEPRCRCAEGAPDESCPVCMGEERWYWCEVCREAVADRRCPQCGLKTKRMRG